MKEKTKMCKKVDAKGITLIALIITIIVMLILVAVTISVALNGGLISKAQEAKTKTGEAQIQERNLLTGRIKVGDTWYDSLDEYLKGNPSEDQSDEPSKWGQDEDGNITYDGEDSGIKVGDYVDYEKYVKASSVGTDEIDGLYEELKNYSGYAEAVKDEKITTGKEYNETYPITKEGTLKWRVLGIKDGQIRLISDGPTTSNMFLYGYNGYNNAVYLIDKVCNTLYTTEKGTAKNLKIEDIEEKMNLDDTNGGWDYHNYTNSYVDTRKYGGTKEYTSSSYRNYPEIFAQEKRAWVDDEEEKDLAEDDGLDLSEQTGPINQTAAKKANSKIKVTQTYWYKSMSESNWKNPTYQNIFIKDSSGSNYSTYWLSSRCVEAFSDSAYFRVRLVHSGGVSAGYLYYSGDNPDDTSYCLRPVVSLKSDVQITANKGTLESPHNLT